MRSRDGEGGVSVCDSAQEFSTLDWLKSPRFEVRQQQQIFGTAGVQTTVRVSASRLSPTWQSPGSDEWVTADAFFRERLQERRGGQIVAAHNVTLAV